MLVPYFCIKKELVFEKVENLILIIHVLVKWFYEFTFPKFEVLALRSSGRNKKSYENLWTKINGQILQKHCHNVSNKSNNIHLLT